MSELHMKHLDDELEGCTFYPEILESQSQLITSKDISHRAQRYKIHSKYIDIYIGVWILHNY